MLCRLLLIFICSLFLSCTNSQQKKDEKGQEEDFDTLSIDDEELKNIRVCTELPVYSDDTVKAGRKGMGSVKNLRWDRKTKVLNVAFLDGDITVQEKVKSAAKEWENYCGITFNFIGADDKISKPEITISFKERGAWSRIGKESLAYKPSMNLGWLNADTKEEEYRTIVLHEFGHALGLIHEHQNPNKNPIKWNKQLVYKYYSLPPNRWSREVTDKNLFVKYSVDETFPSSEFDPKSIMVYFIPKQFTTDGYSTKANGQLSETDKTWINLFYPKE